MSEGRAPDPEAAPPASAGTAARNLWRALWHPDPLLNAPDAHGERVVARIRLLVLVLLLATQIAPAGAVPVERTAGRIQTALIVVYAAVVYVVVARVYRRWMGFVTSVLDVSMVSLALGCFLLLDRPHLVVNSRVVFDTYFLALAFAALRYDWRVCALTTLVAVSEYGGVVLYAARHWDLNNPRYAPFPYGMFDWAQQVDRLILLLCMGVATAAIVVRARSLRWLSSTDRLTGLLNRGAFDERLLDEHSRARRHRSPFTLALVDIDHFKPFNDTYGHMAGDAALRRVAETLRRAVRRSDVVCRYGGEEFALLLPESRAEDALPRIEGIRRAIALTPVSALSAATGITVSIGVASWPFDGEHTSEVLAEADRRLYQAKRTGRNRVVSAPASRERQNA